jgi:hypothetical protein
MKIAILLFTVVSFFLVACGTVVEPQDGAYLQFSVENGHNPETTMLTFEVDESSESMFEKWQNFQGQDESQEKWIALVEKHDRDVEEVGYSSSVGFAVQNNDCAYSRDCY